MELKSTDTLSTSHDQWLDKLWLSLFGGDDSGLLSPGQIRRERRNRTQVRQLEMAAVLEAEGDINDIHRGVKALDDTGNLIDTPTVEAITTHQVIEDTGIEQNLDVGLDAPATMIRSVVKELSVRDLGRTLNLRKIAILSERLILDSPEQAISKQPINAEWMTRWRESAVSVLNPELQTLWARMLIGELAQPGCYSLGLMASLLHLNIDDLEMVRIVSKYAFADFIYDASDSYFNTELHHNIFEVMEDLGLLAAIAVSKPFKSASNDSFSLTLPCQNKALKVTHVDRSQALSLSVYKLSRVGKQLFKLCAVDADLAYLFDFARHIKQKGFNVALGDWDPSVSTGQFIEKMAL